MPPKLKALRTAILTLCFVLIACSIIGGVIGYSPVPYWDMWGGTVRFVQTFNEDPARLLFSQHNEHRIVLSRLLFLVDYYVFGGTSTFLIVCNYLFATAIWIVFAACLLAINADIKRQPEHWIMVAILGAWLFLWAQKVNFTWAFQSQFFLAQLLPLLAFLALGQAAVRERYWNRYFCFCLLLGGLSLLTMANGLFVFPLLTCAAMVLRIRRSQIVIFAVCSIAAAALYLSDYQVPATHGSVFETLISQPFAALRYTFTYLGNPSVYIAGSSAPMRATATMLGFSLAAITFILSLRSIIRPPKDPVAFGLLVFIVFVGASALVTAAGRLPFGQASAYSSRYTTPVLMAWAALFCIASPGFLKFHNALPHRQYLTLSGALIGLLILSVSQFRALQPMHAIKHQKAVAVLALELGIADNTTVAVIHPNAQSVLGIARQASDKDLGLFGRPQYKNARELIGTRFKASPIRTCAGKLVDFEVIDNAPDYMRLRGWQFDSRQSYQPRRVYIINSENVVVGLALPGRESPELETAFGHAASRAGFTGYIRSSALSGELAIVADHCQSLDRF